MKKVTKATSKTAVKATSKKATAKAKPTGKQKTQVDPKRLAAMEAILENILEDGEEGGKIHAILTLHIKGFSNVEIVEVGFNKSTVYRQVGEYKKLKKAPATHYQGFPIYEARIQRVMKSKNCTREKAIAFIDKSDIAALENKSDN
jgi:hypothetical protein